MDMLAGFRGRDRGIQRVGLTIGHGSVCQGRKNKEFMFNVDLEMVSPLPYSSFSCSKDAPTFRRRQAY